MGRHRINSPVFRLVVGGLFFGAFLAGGVFAAYKFATELPMAIASNGWPTAEGHVTLSRVARARKGRKSHRLQYEYRVGQRSYESGEIAFMGRVFGRNARDRQRLYPEGQRVLVYYHPDDPSIGVLEPGVRKVGFLGAIVFAAIFALFGLWGLRATMRPLGS